MKRTLTTLFGLALAGAAFILPAQAADKLKVGFVYVGPVGDFGWTFQHEVGRRAIEKEFGDKIETTYLENVPEGPDAERAIEQLARAEQREVVSTRQHVGPVGRAFDEIDVAFLETLCTRGRPNGVCGFRYQQRFIARQQIRRTQPLLEARAQIVGVELHAAIIRNLSPGRPAI